MFNKRNAAYVFLSLLISVGVFAYLFREISIGDVVEIIRSVNPNALMMFFVLSFFMSIFRTWRYSLALQVSGYSPSHVALFLVVLVRNLFSDLLPARLGTLIYVYLVNTRLGVPIAVAGSSFALAFLFDLLAVAPLVVLAVGFSLQTHALHPWTLLVSGIVFALVISILIVTLPKLLGMFEKCLAFLPFLPQRAKSFAQKTVVKIAVEIDHARKKGIYVQLLILSVFVRLFKYGSLYVFLVGILMPLGYSFETVEVSKAFLGIFSAELAASTPVSGIAGFGLYEGAWAATFQILGFPKDLASLTAVSHHLFTQAYGYSLGAVALLTLLLPCFRVSKLNKSDEKVDNRFYFRLVSVVLVGFFVLSIVWRVPFAKTEGRVIQPTEGPSDRELKKRNELAKTFNAQIVFDSNRSGTFGLYVINPDGSNLRTLVDTSFHEMTPEPLPDGSVIFYTVARSLSRIAPSDIWSIKYDGSEAGLLIEDAAFPSLSKNDNFIYFERNRKSVFRYNRRSRKIKRIFPGKDSSFRGKTIVKPQISPDGSQVAFFSDVGGRWTAWLSDVKGDRFVKIGKGCEPTWAPDGESLAWVFGEQAKAGSGIYSFKPKDGSRVLLQDEGGKRGHEYFPSFSPDGSHLLYASCPSDEHSHETANYQIYLKNLIDGDFARITFDSYTNRWPKRLESKSLH